MFTLFKKAITKACNKVKESFYGILRPLSANTSLTGFTREGQVGAIILVCIMLIAITMGLIVFKIPPKFFLILITALGIFIIAFIKTNVALIILIFAMLLSPELAVGGVPGRAVVLRLEDILLLIVFLGWLAKMAVNKELGLLRVTSLNRPILIYMSICIIASLLGVLRGYLTPKVSIFYLLKYFEYFLLYFMVTNSLENKKQVKLFVYSLIFVALLISIYAWGSHFSGAIRVTAPFEGESGEPNTLGGYLLLIMMVTTGLWLNLSSRKIKVFLSIVLFFAFPAFLFTLSRSSWLGFIPAFLMLIILTPKGKTILLLVLFSTILLGPLIFPDYVSERVTTTFMPGKEYTFLGKRLTLDDSTAARVDSWGHSFKKWIEAPFLGHGAGSSGAVVDNQYTRFLVEFGAFGLIAFIWIAITIFRNALLNLKKFSQDDFARGLTVGFIAGFVGLLFHSFGAATFIIIRIMEPFWFLTAIVMMLPEISTQPEASRGQELPRIY